MFELQNPVDLVFGAGVLNQLGSKVKGLGQRALIVTGRTSARQSGALDRVVQQLAGAGIESVLYEAVTPNPLASTVTAGAELAVEQGCDFVVGIGGGSPIDAAKAIALMAVNPGVITDYQPGNALADQSPEKALPIVAITTTAGTGTEINRYFVITNDETHEKPGLGYRCTYPSVAFVDPELMLSLPVEATVDTGVDVLFHSMEAFISKVATPFSDLLAEEAINLVLENIQAVVFDGNNLQARTNMAWANTLGGWAIDIAGTVGIHSAGHPISGHFNTTHAKSLAALGPAYFQYNYAANIPKYAQLSEILGLHDHDFDLPDEEKAAQAGHLLHHILEKLNMALKISDFGVSEQDLDTLVHDTLTTMAGGLANNSRPLGAEDLKAIYHNAF
jgi:alcohol dehydrogenase